MRADMPLGALTPEDEELERKRQERADLEEELTQCELHAVTMKGELDHFRVQYLRAVGLKYRELNALEDEIAELARLQRQKRDQAVPTGHGGTGGPDLFEMFERPGSGVSALKMDAEVEKLRTDGKPIDLFEVFERLRRDAVITAAAEADELKRLYRLLAKQVHPDLVVDDAARERRRIYMSEINDASAQGDLDRLKDLFKRWRVSPHNVEGEGAGAELVRVIREIAQVRHRLAELTQEIATLETSDLYQLKKKADDFRLADRDYLEELAENLDGQIIEARMRRDRLKEVGT